MEEGAGRRSVLSFVGQHQRRTNDSRELLHDEPDLRPVSVDLRSVELVCAPFLVSTTSGIASPSVCRTWSGLALEVVRGLPRPRGLLQRAVRPAHQGADRHARGPGGAGVHVMPLHLARREHDGARGLRHRVSAPARSGRQRKSVPSVRARPAAVARSGAAPEDVSQALPPRTDAGILLVLSQGAPRRARERLPLVSRIQRLRQLAGVGRVRGRARSFYYRRSRRSALDCHIPLVKANDPAAKNGMAVAPIRRRQYGSAVRQQRRGQLRLVQQFLGTGGSRWTCSGWCGAPTRPRRGRSCGADPAIASTFAVGGNP